MAILFFICLIAGFANPVMWLFAVVFGLAAAGQRSM